MRVGVSLEYSTLVLNMKAVLAGPRFMSHYLTCLKQRQTIILVTQEQNIIVKIAVVIMDIYLMMDLNQLEKDFVTMVSV